MRLFFRVSSFSMVVVAIVIQFIRPLSMLILSISNIGDPKGSLKSNMLPGFDDDIERRTQTLTARFFSERKDVTPMKKN